MTLATRLGELVQDDVTGRSSSTKALTVGTWLAATVVFISAGWKAEPGEGIATLLFTYVGLFTANNVVMRGIAAKWGGSSKPAPKGATTP